jgi:plasmid stabilization system protein ParE
MEVKISSRFSEKLEHQVEYIALDKPKAAIKFQKELIAKIQDLGKFPYRCKTSSRFDDEFVRELVFKGYSIFYRIDEAEHSLTVFGFTKYENK